MAKVAVVILNWNGKKFLQQFLHSVTTHVYNSYTEIWVADNGSTDTSIAFLQENFPQVKLICLDKNYGFTGGYNKALAKIEAEYYILLNSDVEVRSSWIEPIIERMDTNSNIAAAAPKILSWHEQTKFEYAGASGGYIDRLGYPFCRGRVISNIETDFGQYNNEASIFWASGACMFVRAKVFHELGGFDDIFFAHMEEIDLCWRMKNAGYDIRCFPQSAVYHVGGGTLPNESPQKTYLNYRNNLLLLHKNLPKQKHRTVLTIRFFFDIASAFLFVLQKKIKLSKSVLKAYKDFFKLKKNYRLDYSTAKDHPEILRSSIILSFFLLKRRKYAEITKKTIK